MPKNLYLNSSNHVTLNSTADTSGLVEGVISNEALNCYEFRVALNAFDSSIEARKYSGVKGVKFLFDHNRNQAIGVVKNIYKENGNLKIECQLNLDLPIAKEIYSNLKMGVGAGFSVGFRANDDIVENGIRIITEGDLFEVSLTYFPANEDCTVEKVLHMDDKVNLLTSVDEKLDRLLASSVLDIADSGFSANSLDYIRTLEGRIAALEPRVAKLESVLESYRASQDSTLNSSPKAHDNAIALSEIEINNNIIDTYMKD